MGAGTHYCPYTHTDILQIYAHSKIRLFLHWSLWHCKIYDRRHLSEAKLWRAEGIVDTGGITWLCIAIPTRKWRLVEWCEGHIPGGWCGALCTPLSPVTGNRSDIKHPGLAVCQGYSYYKVFWSWLLSEDWWKELFVKIKYWYVIGPDPWSRGK
jgi:hypothetical protein